MRQIAIVLYPGLTGLDALGPYEMLRYVEGAELRFVAHTVGPVLADSGVLAVGATHTFAETPRPDVILVPGSEANTLTAMADGKLLDWLKTAHQTSQYTTSVCSGALVLAAAGLLEGAPATTHWAAMSGLARLGAIPQPDARLVRSGKIWTAAGVSAGIDMALALLAEMDGDERAQVAQLMTEYAPEPPFASGHMSTAPKPVQILARAEIAQRSRNARDVLSAPSVAWALLLNRVRRMTTRR